MLLCRVSMDFGGRDISRVMLWLLRRIGFPYKECQLSNRLDLMLVQEIKEMCCHLDQVSKACSISPQSETGFGLLVFQICFSYSYFTKQSQIKAV